MQDFPSWKATFLLVVKKQQLEVGYTKPQGIILLSI